MKINTEKNIFDDLSEDDVFKLEKSIKNEYYYDFFTNDSDLELKLKSLLFTESIKQIIERSLYHFYKNKILDQSQNNNENIEYYNVYIDDRQQLLGLNNYGYDYNFKSYESCLNFIQNLKPNIQYIENSINREGVNNYRKEYEEVIDHRNCDVTYMNQKGKLVHAVPKHQYKFDRIEFTDIINHQYNENEKNLQINIFMSYKGFQVWKELESIETEAGIFSREIDKEKIVQDWVVIKKPVKQINIKISKKILEFKD